MQEERPVADLHMHTTASDGTSTVKERISQAKDVGLEAIAITDHDTIPGDLTERAENRGGIELITGVEVKAEAFGTRIEILGYYVDPEEPELESLLEKARENRRRRNSQMHENLLRETEIDISFREIRELATGRLGRPHFARLLLTKGYVDSVSEAFDRYLGEAGDIYVPTELVDYTRVIDAIHSAGGLASLAHPGRIDFQKPHEVVGKMAEYGLDGIEVWYPYGSTSSAENLQVGVEEAFSLSEKYDLLRTGGSDCHGRNSSRFRIGEIGVSRKELDEIRSNDVR